MFSRFKRKQGGKVPEKFEFRFQFQASGVPVSGYDRLLVCVVPSGKGRSAAKTQKAPVRNGSVAWQDSVGVRVKLNKDKKGGGYDEAVYKFVVTSNNSRSGVLGEAAINLVDCINFVQKEKSLVLLKGAVTSGTVLHATVTCIRASPRDGNDSASSVDDDAFSEDDTSQSFSESYSESGSMGRDQVLPLRVKVPVQVSPDGSRGSRFSQESQEPAESPVQQMPVLQPTRPTGRDPRMPRYDAYASNGETRNSVPTLAPILIANQPEPVPGPSPPSQRSWGGALPPYRPSDRRTTGSFLPFAQSQPSRGSFGGPEDQDQNGKHTPERPSRSSGSSTGGTLYERRTTTPERRHSLGGGPDPLSVVPPRGGRDAPSVGALPKPSKVKELAAQFREKELGGSPTSPQSPGGLTQPRFQVSTDRYVGRGLDRREVPYTGRPSIDSPGSSLSRGGVETPPSRRRSESVPRRMPESVPRRISETPLQRKGGEVDYRTFSSSRLQHFEKESDLMAELERMEVEIEGLRAQSESWQRSAKNYAAENEQLRGEMKVQIQYTDEAGAEADEAARERDELRAELAKMREVLRESHDDEDRQATAQWEADDAKRHVEELQEELEQQKEQMDNLKMQLDKLHDSNQMLVEEVRDFEEQSNAKEAELQTLQKQLVDVEAQLSSRTKTDGVGPLNLAAKVTALEKEKTALEAQLRSAPGSNSDAGKEDSDAVRTLQKRVAELEAEASELAKESAKLAGNLANAQAEVKQRESRVVELERALKLERAVHEAAQQSPESSIQVARLTNMVKELQGRLTEAEFRPGSAGSDLGRRLSLGSDFGGSNDELRSDEVENILGGLTMLKTLARLRSNDSSEVAALKKKVGQLITQVETNANELSRTNTMVERELAIRRSEVEGATETIRSLEEELDSANQTVHSFEMKLHDANDAIARSGEEVSVLRKQINTLQLDLRSARDGKDVASRTFERLSSGAASETIRNLSEELEAAQKTIQGLEGELESAHVTIQQLEAGGKTPRGLGEELDSLNATVATLRADLASAREGRDNVTRQYDRLKQLLEEDSSEERIEELEKEVQDLKAQLAGMSPAKPSEKLHSDLLAQINTLESTRETLTGQLASQAQEARSARLELETRLEKAELEKTQALEKLKSLEAEVGVLKGAGSPEQEQDAVAAFKGSLQEEAAHSQQRLEASLKKIHQLEEEVNRQSFLVSKAEGAAFEAEERLKLAHLEFSNKSNMMVEKLAALEEQLEQVKSDKKGLEAKHMLTLRGLETRHGEKEQELQRRHLAEWGELHSAKQELEARHEEVSGQKTGLEEWVRELEREKEELTEALAAERKRFADQVSGEKQQYEEKIESLEAEMASVTAQLNESLRVETQMAREYAEKKKALRAEVEKLEERVKELTAEVGEHVRTKEAAQKMWDDSEVSGKEGAEKIRALQSQLDESLLEMKYKVEECEELNARIEELHSLVEDSQAQADEYKQRTDELSAEVASRDGTLKGLQAQLALLTEERGREKEKVEKLTEERELQLQRVKELTGEVEKVTGKLAWQQARVAELTMHLEQLTEERDSHKERAGALLGEVESHKSKGLELAALLEEHRERLAVHEEKATIVSRELETTSTTQSTEAAAQAALLKESQKKVKSLETQVTKLNAQIEDHAAAKEAVHRRMSFAMQEGVEASAKVQGLEEEIERITKEMEAHVSEKEDLKGQLAGTEATKAELEATLLELRKEHEGLLEVKSRLEEEHNGLRAKHDELSVSKDLLAKRHEEACVESEGLRKTLAAQESLVSDLEKEVSRLTMELKTQTERCEESEGKVVEKQSSIKEFETRVKELMEELGTVRKEAGEHHTARTGLEARLEDLLHDHEDASARAQKAEGQVEELSSQVEVLTSQLHQHASSKQEVEARALDLHSERGHLQERLSKSEIAHKGGLERVGALTQELTAVIAAKEVLTAERDSVRTHASGLESEVNELKDELTKVEGTHKGALEKVASLTAELTMLQTLLASREKDSQAADALSQGRIKAVSEEKEALGLELESVKTELARSHADKQAAVERMEEEMRVLHEQFQAGASDKDKMASEALMSATAVRAEKAELEERLRKHADDEKQLEGLVSELEKRVKGLDQDLEAAKEREERLGGQLEKLEAALKEATHGLDRGKLEMSESEKKWQAEHKALEEVAREAKVEVEEMGRKMELETERLGKSMTEAVGSAQAEALRKEEEWKVALEKRESKLAEKEDLWIAESKKLEGRLEESLALSAELTAAKEALDVRVTELAGHASELQKSIDELTKAKAVLSTQVGSLSAALEKETQARENQVKELEAELETRSSQLKALHQSSLELQQSIAELTSAKQALASVVDALRSDLDKEAKVRASAESERDAAQSALRESDEALSLAKQEMALLEAEKRKVEADHHDSGKELLELVREKRSLEARVAELEKERTLLKVQVSEFEKRVEALTAQLTEAKDGLEESRQQREQLQKELQIAENAKRETEGALSSKTRALEMAAATAAAAAASELSLLQKAHAALQSELTNKQAELSKTTDDLAQHKQELEAVREASEATGREFVEHRTQAESELERVRSSLGERTAEVDRLSVDVAKVSAELADARAELSTAVQGRAAAERQLAEATARMKEELAAAAEEKEKAVRQLEAAVAKARAEVGVAVAASKGELQQEIEELQKTVESERANAKRLAMQAANNASAETDELRDENFELKHRLIELETELKSGGGRRFSSGGAPPEAENAVSELRMKVTMLETELRNKSEQLAASERRLQEAREEGIISPGGRPGLTRPVSLARGIASPGAPELLVSPSGRSLLSPGTRRTLAQSRNGRNEGSGSPPGSPGSPAAMEAKRADLQHRVKALEGDLKKVIALLEKAKKEAGERERGLLAEVDRLQAANEQLAQGGFDLGMDQLRSELLRLQNQNAALMRSERELHTQLGMQEVLEEEVLRLQETNDDLFQKISLYRQYGERAKTVERLHVLEVELQEAMEANMMYKEQLKAALSTHQNVSQAAFSNMGGDVDMILDELKMKKQQARKLEGELQEMQERYSALSLKCAEVEGQREELVQELKRLKGGGHNKKPSR